MATTGVQTSESEPGKGSLKLLLDASGKPWGPLASTLRRSVRNADTFLTTTKRRGGGPLAR